VDRGAAQQAVDVFGPAAVAAEETVVPQQPEVARSGRRFVRRCRHGVRVGQPGRALRLEQLHQLVRREPGQAHLEVQLLQFGQFEGQAVVVPRGQLGGLVVGQPVGLQLGGGQARGDVDRHGLQAKLQGRLIRGMADDDHALFIDDARLAEAEFLNRRGDGLDGLVIVAGIVRVRPDGGEWALLELHGSSLTEEVSVDPGTGP
jgi:hypothetical protein